MKTINLNLTLRDLVRILKMVKKLAGGFYVKCKRFYFPAILTSSGKVDLSKWDNLTVEEMQKCDEFVLIKKPFSYTIQVDLTNNSGYTYIMFLVYKNEDLVFSFLLYDDGKNIFAEKRSDSSEDMITINEDIEEASQCAKEEFKPKCGEAWWVDGGVAMCQRGI